MSRFRGRRLGLAGSSPVLIDSWSTMRRLCVVVIMPVIGAAVALIASSVARTLRPRGRASAGALSIPRLC